MERASEAERERIAREVRLAMLDEPHGEALSKDRAALRAARALSAAS